MKRQPWAEDEDAILYAHYAELGLRGCAELIPNRSAGAISIRASLLGLSSFLTKHNRGGRRKRGYGSDSYKEFVNMLRSRPLHVKGTAFSDDWFESCNAAFITAMREHYPEREKAIARAE